MAEPLGKGLQMRQWIRHEPIFMFHPPHPAPQRQAAQRINAAGAAGETIIARLKHITNSSKQ